MSRYHNSSNRISRSARTRRLPGGGGASSIVYIHTILHTIYIYIYTHTILYYTIPYYTILYYNILYYTILYYTILYYTTILDYAIVFGKGQIGSVLRGSLQVLCFLFDRGTFWVLPLTYLYLPKSARAYLFPQSVKTHYFRSGPISVDPIFPQPSYIRTTLVIVIMIIIIMKIIIVIVITMIMLMILIEDSNNNNEKPVDKKRANPIFKPARLNVAGEMRGAFKRSETPRPGDASSWRSYRARLCGAVFRTSTSRRL